MSVVTVGPGRRGQRRIVLLAFFALAATILLWPGTDRRADAQVATAGASSRSRTAPGPR